MQITNTKMWYIQPVEYHIAAKNRMNYSYTKSLDQS